MYLKAEEIEALYQAIQASDRIIIHRHVRPDPDAIGSQLGLKALITAQFPDKKVLASGTISAGLTWMGQMDEVTDEDYQDALVIVTDTANQPRIDDKRFNNGAKLVKIDHHPEVDLYGDIQIAHTEASSCSEMIEGISHYLGDRLPMNAEAAELIYAGVVADTGRFLYNSTTALTFESMARLKSFDFDAFAINDHFQVMTAAEASFQGHALKELKINEDGVATLLITREDLKTFAITEEQTNSVVGLPGRIEGVITWAIFVEQQGGNPSYRCRIRSKGPSIDQIAMQHQGGGHPKASGANAKDQAELQQIIEELSLASRLFVENRVS